MRIVYIADDGTQFDDKFECEDYEWGLQHTNLNRIRFMDEDYVNIQYKYDFSDGYLYFNTNTIYVPDEQCVKELIELAEYAGWGEWDNITEPGLWAWNCIDGINYKFIKVGDTYGND